jgi:hypothetical protein
MIRYYRQWIPGTKYTRAGWYVMCKIDEQEADIIDGPYTEGEVEAKLQLIGDWL